MKLREITGNPVSVNRKAITLFQKGRKAMKARNFLIGFLFAAFCLVHSSQADVPQMINYQGVLTDSLGDPVCGNYDMTFSVYEGGSGGTPLWTETQMGVDVEGGVFNVLLNIPYSVFNGDIRYLGVAVDDPGDEMIPRRPIVSAGYAFRAEFSDTAEYARLGAPDEDWIVAGDDMYCLAGNVGIGTTNPTEMLDVAGTVRMDAFEMPTGAHTDYVLTSDATGTGMWKPPGTGGLPPGVFGNTLRHDGTSWVGDTLLYNDSTKIGIGTTSPSAKLELRGDNVFLGDTNTIRAAPTSASGSDPDSNWIQMGYVTGFGPMVEAAELSPDLLPRLTLDAHQSSQPETPGSIILGLYGDWVGIGTGPTGPNFPLEVNGHADFEGAVTLGDTMRGRFGWGGQPVDSSTVLLAGYGRALWLGSNHSYMDTQGILIDSYGKVGIGTTTPGAKLHVNGTPGVDGIMFPDGSLQTTAAGGGGGCWSLTGNSGTTPGTHFVGTTDNAALVLKVNNDQVLRIEREYAGVSPNLIGGYSGNSASSDVEGCVIGGGGDSDSTNRVTDDFCTVAGGLNNEAGDSNPAYHKPGATVGGGRDNVSSNEYCTVAGGRYNVADRQYATVAGGYNNWAHASYAAVAGGSDNIASWGHATVGGGAANKATSLYATVPGGMDNVAAGIWSFAAGNKAKANHHGSIVLSADSSNFWSSDSIRSGGEEQMVLRADGGMYITNTSGVAPYTPTRLINTSVGAYLSSSGIWQDASGKNLLENFTAVDGSQLLEKITMLPVTLWNYKVDSDEIKHIGPVAQDFYDVFGLGYDDKTLSSLDLAGIVLIGIQELEKSRERQRARIEQLEVQVSELQEIVAALLAAREGK